MDDHHHHNHNYGPLGIESKNIEVDGILMAFGQVASQFLCEHHDGHEEEDERHEDYDHDHADNNEDHEDDDEDHNTDYHDHYNQQGLKICVQSRKCQNTHRKIYILIFSWKSPEKEV